MTIAFIQNLGPWQLVICLVIAFALFGGAKKLPEMARALGKAKGEFKKGLAEGEKIEAEAREKSAEATPEKLEGK